MRPLSSTARPLVLALGLLALAGCSGQPQDLRGPAPQAGQTYRSEMTLTVTKGTITLTAGGEPVTGEADLSMRAVEEEEVLAVADGQVTGIRTKVITDQATETVRIEGQADTHTDSGPLEGETVLCEKAGEGWKTTLVGKAPTPRQAVEMEMLTPPESPVDEYPDGPVKPGHVWTVDAARLRQLMGKGVQIDSGTWKRKFEKTVEVEGEPCAHIAEEIELRGKARDEHGAWSRVELQAKGTTVRSLKRGFSLSTRLSGTLTQSGTVTEDGEKVQVTLSGPMTLEAKTQRK
jgi:hypothetical protein